MKLVSVSLLLLAAAIGVSAPDYPAAPGFNQEGSDPEAIAIANEVMAALGGYDAWNDTRYLTWSFFGRRTHLWDKHTGNLRFENEGTTVLMNINTKQGRVFESGEEVLDPAKRDEALDRAHGAWINDSYWVFMPYKLKDSGVTLEYVGERTTAAGAPADVLELTFVDVGRTPENRYHVYVDETSRLVTQWDYYQVASDTEPGFRIPWNDWKKHGDILLSADRGERKHENVAVLEDVPASAFESPAALDPLAYAR